MVGWKVPEDEISKQVSLDADRALLECYAAQIFAACIGKRETDNEIKWLFPDAEAIVAEALHLVSKVRVAQSLMGPEKCKRS